ncbi:cytochrome P450 [Dothidotthia symphoricarpi CBS 119687]|uniref:Cytochrome P450 n=1 Tax=Dothidotthia symphoricarpi CBS 119687 TaxID=1392245 RepID=A0A6A6A9F4_9PLEO|nr:cytochrome P450 [Dothidotthia symphoricarpi CBS 119687]KAF2127467.1 cytochrome P450 [Dothidotthia symphoricarpi CBS 119687]
MTSTESVSFYDLHVLRLDNLKTSIILAASGWLLFQLVGCIRNVYFHPLSKFPGPRTAAASSWWSAYQQTIANRSMHHICKKLHAQYGDIIRIGPNRLHFNHPDSYEEIYRKRFDKDPFMYALLGGDGSTVTYVKYHDNKNRKDILHPFFSKSSVHAREELIQANIEMFCSLLTRHHEKGVSANMRRGFRCISLETITTMCFGKSLACFEFEDFHCPILESMDMVVSWFMVFKHYWVVRHLILYIPEWVGLAFFKKGLALAHLKNMLAEQIDELAVGSDKPTQNQFPTIYGALLDPAQYSKSKPPPSRASLLEEAIALVIAGTDTIGATMTMCTYQLCKYPEKVARLKAELRAAWPDLKSPVPNVQKLEKLPYLTAVIKEALRMAPTTTSELSRMVSPQGAEIGGEVIPGGTIVSMGVLFTMQHPYAYELPELFIPERWLEEGEDAKRRLDRYFVPFSKGPRSCIGINFAWCEMYLTLANLFRRFDLSVDGTKDEDFDWFDAGVALFKGSLKCHVTPVTE